MRELAPHDRPREKLARAGADTLGDNELVAVLIGHGTATASALALANRVLAVSKGVHGLTRIDRAELASIPGVGAALASRILAAVQLGRRTLTVSPVERPRLVTPHEQAGFLLPLFGAFAVERFGLLLLDASARPIRTRLLSSGTRDASLVHPREVFREAVLASASGIVLFHNHPSGDATPSVDDYALTRRLISAGKVMGIDIVDHLVLADNQYSSMRLMGRF